MNILFVHQNFPAQFKHLAPALKNIYQHDVRVITIASNAQKTTLDTSRYKPKHDSAKNIHPWLMDFEAKVIRGESVFEAAMQMRDDGFYPDVMIAHPGWGESLFLKDV